MTQATPTASRSEEHFVELLRSTRTAQEILGTDYPEPSWVIPGILPQGLAVLCGKPKVGKSWMALGIAVASSVGGTTFGRYGVSRGSVLYLALEDTERRIKSRLDVLQAVATDTLHFRTSWPVGEDGLRDLRLWLQGHGETRLVVIDTLGKIRDPRVKMDYLNDVHFMSGLKKIADKFQLCMFLIHHERKMQAVDVLDRVSGTTGIAGSADTVWVLQRARNDDTAVLHVSSRDFSHEPLGMRFEYGPKGWTHVGSAAELGMSQERQQIMAMLRESGDGMRPREVARVLNKDRAAVRMTLSRMARAGELDSEDGRYYVRRDN